MPIYDCYCETCKKEKELWLKVDETEPVCEKCGSIMKRRCGGHFKLVYNNKTDMCSWGNEGYSSSQYWNAYKKAKGK